MLQLDWQRNSVKETTFLIKPATLAGFLFVLFLHLPFCFLALKFNIYEF